MITKPKLETDYNMQEKKQSKQQDKEQTKTVESIRHNFVSFFTPSKSDQAYKWEKRKRKKKENCYNVRRRDQ